METEISNEDATRVNTVAAVEESIIRLLDTVDSFYLPAQMISTHGKWYQLRFEPGVDSAATFLRRLRNTATRVFPPDVRETEIINLFRAALETAIHDSAIDAYPLRMAFDTIIKWHHLADGSKALLEQLEGSMAAGSVVVQFKSGVQPKRTRAEPAQGAASAAACNPGAAETLTAPDVQSMVAAVAALQLQAPAPQPVATSTVNKTELAQIIATALAAQRADSSAVGAAAAAAGSYQERPRTVKGILDLSKIAAAGALPPGMSASEFHAPSWKGAIECAFCLRLRRTNWTKEYKSKEAYRTEHGCDPWSNAPGDRKIPWTEALPHSEGGCPSAWIYYNKLAEKEPELAWTAIPLEDDEQAARLLADAPVA